MRHYLLVRNDEYYIMHGKNINLPTRALLPGLTPITSISCTSKKLAYKILVAAAWAHYKKLHATEDLINHQ